MVWPILGSRTAKTEQNRTFYVRALARKKLNFSPEVVIDLVDGEYITVMGW